MVLLLVWAQPYACNTDKSLNITEGDIILKMDTMKLKITVGNKTATAVLYDNHTSRDFAAMHNDRFHRLQ